MPAFPGPTRSRSVIWPRACWILALSLTLGLGTAQARDERVRLEVERDGDRFFVHAEAEIAADPRIAWETVTDYEKLPEFVPHVQRTRVQRRSTTRLVVDYAGEFDFWFVRRIAFMRLDVTHEPFTTVIARGLPDPPEGPAATVRDFFARYDLAVLRLPPAAGGGTGVRLTYEARFAPVQPLPAVVGTWAVRQAMRAQFEALVHEIERRHAAAPRGIAPRAESPTTVIKP